VQVLAWIVECDLDRNTLHHLDEIAGRILGRQQRELRTGASLEAVDAPLKAQTREGVNRCSRR
jgi:hypothetical protein